MVGALCGGGCSRQEAPAYRHILFRPQFSEGLTSASASLETPYGLIQIGWECKGRRMEGGLKVPLNTYADFEFLAPGTLYEGKKSRSFEGRGKIRISPGDYRLSRR